MHDLPNVQMLLSATKECFIRELFGNQLPPPYNFSKTFLPTSPKAFLLPFSLTIFTMNELLPESILFLHITWFFFNTTQRLKDTRCILAYHRSSPVGWFPVWIHSLVWILPHLSVPEWWPVLLESPKSVRKSATTLHSWVALTLCGQERTNLSSYNWRMIVV